MKKAIRILGLWGCVLALGACGDASEQDTPATVGQLSLRETHSLDGADCGPGKPACAQGTACLFLELATNGRSVCMDPADVCNRLQCSAGRCAVLLSDPGRVICVL